MRDRLVFAALTVCSLLLSPLFFRALSYLFPGTIGIFISLALFTIYYAYLIHLSTHILSEMKGPIALFIPVTLIISILICYVLAFIPWSWDLLPETTQDLDGYVTNFYYIVETFTSVGYGDIVPEDTRGRVFASLISLLGAAHAIGFLTILLLKVEHGKTLTIEELPEKTGSDEAPKGHTDSQKNSRG
jgi:predicted ABC-type exoprotein transport system permease subunit